MLVDFIAQTDIPAVLLAKALTSKTEFDKMLSEDAKLQQRLKEIGYVLKLDQTQKNSLAAKLAAETDLAQAVKDKIAHRAHIFSSLLTNILKRMAEKSPQDTEIIYNLSQILFLWDEFIDFDDYQQNNGDVTKIRESVFYRAASEILQKMSDIDLTELENLDFHIPAFEKSLYKLQAMNGETRLTPDQSFTIIEILRSIPLTNPEIVFFLLVIESALFVKIADDSLSRIGQIDMKTFANSKDLKIAIQEVREKLRISPDQLEECIEKESWTIVLNLTVDIFS